MDPGVLTDDILGREDGPSVDRADLWVLGQICEECFDEPPLAYERIGARCTQRAEAHLARVIPSIREYLSS